MKYFSEFPQVYSNDANGNLTIQVNLLSRISVIKSLFTNPLLYYTYDIQEGDTPEIIAHKYYGDMYRYWIVLLFNEINDPQWDWPMTGEVFNKYLQSKYTTIDVYNDVHHYEKIITQYEHTSQVTTKNVLNIDQNEFDSLIEETITVSLPTGAVSVTISKQSVNYYDYEMILNESKRTIKLLNKNYVNEIESQFKKLMS